VSAELDLGINDLYPLFLMFLRSSHTFVGKKLCQALIELWLEWFYCSKLFLEQKPSSSLWSIENRRIFYDCGWSCIVET